MSARSVGNVVVSFGMTEIGLKLYVSASPEAISFNMICPDTHNRVTQKCFDAGTGNEIDRSTTLKGYEYASNKFVYFTEEEIDKLQADQKDTIEIVEFVPASEINPLQIEKTYYTCPNKGMDKGYKFLYELLKGKNCGAVGTWVSRGKEHLVIIQAYQHGLILTQMFYKTEVREFEDKCANVPISPTELELGNLLIDSLFNPVFDSSKYQDGFAEKVTQAVRLKIEGDPKKVSKYSKLAPISGLADSLKESLLKANVPEVKIRQLVAATQQELPVEKPKRTRKAG